MAELYDQKKIQLNLPQNSPQGTQSSDVELENLLAELPPEEREAARAKITAAPTGEDINRAMQERNANGEVFNMSLDQYRLWKAHHKTKEVDIIDTMGQAAGGVFDEIMRAAGSVYDKPLESTAKLTPSLIEAFAQGTRNLYGMAAQSQDPDSVFFRVKNALTANGNDEEAEYQQFMEAQKFNVHSMRLASGQDTVVMDKDIINPEMTQVMSYIADPTLFVPFGGIAAKGARLVGMGETLAKASARASVIQRKVLGGALKWGVGAPIEFMGTAVRNTIDYGLERAGSAFEVATGMPVAEAQATAKTLGLQTASAALSGQKVGVPLFGDVASAMVGSTTARGVGEALTMVGEQIGKQAEHGRGVLSYAGQALRDAKKSGVPLSKHAKALLNVLDKVDPLFVYSADISKGAAEGMAIGGGLGYLSGGEEGAASGAGAGMALGAAGAGMGGVVSDIGNGRLYDRIAVQRQMVIEGLRKIDPYKASAFEAFAKTAELTGNRDLIAQVDGIITGIDVMAPNAKFIARSDAEHTAWLLSQRIDPKTGRLMEPLALFPEFGTDRKSRAKALSFLSFVGNRFDGDHKLLIKELQSLHQDHSLRKQFFRLSDEQKKAVFDALDKASTPEYKEKFGGKKGYEFYGDLNYAEANVARVNAMFDAGNKTQANEMIRTFLKNETGKDGKLTARGELLKQKLATEGYFDKDGNMRPSRLKDVEVTADRHKNSKGFVIRRDSTGQVEININLSSFGKETAPHELFHAVMLDSVLKPDFIDRLGQNLLGKFDANGKRIENASVDIKQVKQFFQRYIDSLHGKNSPEAKNETARLEAAMKEYESRGTTNKLELKTKDTLEGLLEEFGSYYFGAFINDKPVDFLFRGGELGAMREIMGNAKQGFLDFWRSKIKGINPDFNFDPAVNEKIFKAFEKDGIRTKNASLDLLMRDFVRATAMANKQGGFDISRLSPSARETFVKNNGIRGLSLTRDANGNLVRSSQRKVIQEQMRVGKEIYKILSGLDPKFRQGLITDGEGNLSGRLSPEAMEAMVQSGHVDRAWVDKIQQAYNIIDGKGGNVIHFGYLGRTAQIGDYAWPRLVGSDVPFKNRQAVLLGVDFKVGKDGKMYSLFHTLDKAVIDGRADVLWSDSAVRTLWNGDRGAMEADFFRYLANASLPSSDVNRKTSAGLLEDGTGAGARRRDVLHQMLGMVKAEGDVYLNKPIAEIPYGIRHSVTTFNVDGIANMRVGTDRWNVVPENAFKDLSRNFQPSEMAREETPNGAIITHASGFKFAEKNGKIHAYTSAGRRIGVYDNIELASKAAKNEYSKVYDNIDTAVAKETQEQDNIARKFQPLEESERLEARRLGDVFLLPSMRRFVEGRTLLRQTREEHIFQRALEAIENPEQLLAYAHQVFGDHLNIKAEYDRLIADITEKENQFEGEKTIWASSYYRKLNQLRDVKYGYPSSFEDWQFDQRNQGNWNPPERIISTGIGMGDLNTEYSKYIREGFSRYEADAKAAWAKLAADPEYIELQKDYNQKTTYFVQRANELIQIRDGIEEFKKQNKEALESPVVQKLTDVLDNYKDEEKAGIFAKLVEASVNQKDYSGLLEALFAQEYDDKIQTGKPFVAVTTHGTGNIELMMSRLFAADKLGSHYDIPSSRMGSFSAGSQNTSKAYAKRMAQPDTSTRAIIRRVYSLNEEGKNLVTKYNEEVIRAITKDYENEKKTFELKGYNEPFESFLNDQIERFVTGRDVRWANFGIERMLAEIKKIDSQTLKVYPDKQMQLRKVIRMDNPYVVVDPRSYEEHYISPHMKRAMEAGHDGIVFKRFADGGERDNVYVVFKDFMKDNIKVIDTSFDGEGVPRGSDETGRVLKGGRELKLAFQPTEGAEGGRVYDQNSNEFKFNFIGKQAEENQDLIQDKNLEFVKRKDGSYRITLTDNGEGYNTRKIGHITATIDDASVVAGEGAAEISSNIDPKYRGQKLANILYSEMAERLRSMGIKYVDGTIVNKDGIPVQVRNTVIGQTYYKGSNKPAFREDTAKKVQAVQSVYPSKGIGVYNELDPKARYQPAEYQGGDDYYKPKKNIFEHKDEQGLLVRKAFVSNREITGDQEARGGKTNPEYVGWEDIGHYPQEGTTAENIWEARNSGLWYWKDDKGVKTKNPMQMDRPDFTHAEWFDRVFQYEDDRPTIYGRYEKPKYDKEGNLVEKGKLSISSNYRGEIKDMADANFYKEAVANSLGVPEDHIDAYLFGANDKIKSQRGYGLKDELPIKFQPTEGFNPREEVVRRANQAGYTLRGYHITNADFNEFDLNAKKVNRGNNPAGAYFATEEGSGYKGKRRINAFIKLEKPWTGKFTNADKEAFKVWFKDRFASEYEGANDTHIAYLDGKMNDMVKRGYFPSLMSGNDATAFLLSRGYDGWKDGSDVAVFKPENIKSADDFTYDDSGKEIPIEERFNKNKKDIRYQPTEGDEGIVPDVDFDAIIRADKQKQKNAYRGKQYAPEQMTFSFIGRYASERPELIKGLELMYSGTGTSRSLVLSDSDTGKRIGSISLIADPESLNKHAYIQMSDVVKQGRGYGTLLYSELAERLRSEGYTSIDGRVVDNLGRPLKIRASVIDKVNRDLGKSVSNVVGDRVSSPLYPEAHYQPAEEFGIKATEGFKWYQRSIGGIKIPLEKEHRYDNALADVFERKMTYAEAAKKNNLSQSEVKNIASRYAARNPSVSSELPTEILKNYKFKWYEVPENQRGISLDKAKRLDMAMDDIISNGITIKESAQKHSLSIKDLHYAVQSSRERGSEFARLLHGKNIESRDTTPYSLNEESGLLKISKENRQKIFSMREQGYTLADIGQDIGISFQAVSKILNSENKPKLQPSEGFSNFTTERTHTGVILKNAAGYVISRVGSKYRVYNPYKAVIGVFDSEEQAKKRIYKEEPRR